MSALAALPVGPISDLERSRAFCEDVLGLPGMAVPGGYSLEAGEGRRSTCSTSRSTRSGALDLPAGGIPKAFAPHSAHASMCATTVTSIFSPGNRIACTVVRVGRGSAKCVW